MSVQESSPCRTPNYWSFREKKLRVQERVKATVRSILDDLKSCSIKKDLECGKRVHVEVLERGYESSCYVANALVNMYAKCGSMVEAHQVFDSIKHPTVVSWTALLSGYAESGQGRTALDLFMKMKSQGCRPDAVTYMASLKACIALGLQQEDSGKVEGLEWGRRIHMEIGHHSELQVQNTLIDMYAKCGCVADAHQVFDSIRHPDLVSWNALLLGYANSRERLVVLDLLSRMKVQGLTPDTRTYVAVLKACTPDQNGSDRAECLEQGKQIHSEIGCRLDLHVQNTLIDMYAKCGSMLDAHGVFNSITHPDVVSWTALLLGYADSGQGLGALDLFLRMKSEGCRPNSITYAAVLKACSLVGALEFGRKIHAEIRTLDQMLVTCLVDFYAKCGSLEEAHNVLVSHSRISNLNAWTALLAGYSSFGETDCVFRLFMRMEDLGFQPDGVTFQCILMCCSHAGLVEKARECFQAMLVKYKVTPCIEHYNCMVDVLSRANRLDDAIALLCKMPRSPNAVTWMTLLGACRKWKHVDIGRLAFQSLVNLDERNAASYVLCRDNMEGA